MVIVYVALIACLLFAHILIYCLVKSGIAESKKPAPLSARQRRTLCFALGQSSLTIDNDWAAKQHARAQRQPTMPRHSVANSCNGDVASSSVVRCPDSAPADDSHQLPSRQQLVTRFGLFKSQCTPGVAANGEVSCGCEQCGRWKAFLQGRLDGGPSWRQYEIWTREYIDQLAAYLWQRALELCLEHMLVLEVGGGDGRLSAHLQAAMAALRPAASRCSVDIHCSDSGLCGLHARSPLRTSVELLPCDVALAKHRPDVVLCSWMPLGVDWTSSVRTCSQVKEYILIGEADSSICGNAERTWGEAADNNSSSDADDAVDIEGSSENCGSMRSSPQGEEPAQKSPLGAATFQMSGSETGRQLNSSTQGSYATRGESIEQGQSTKRQRRLAADGFLRVDLLELSRLQLCCTDERWLAFTKSCTVSFRRQAS